MKFNQLGLDLIKSFEGCKLKAYQDLAGIWTCGYGTTGSDVGPTTAWSQDYADMRLMEDVQKTSNGVEKMVKNLSDNQFSALVCFAYNLGLGALKGSTLLRTIYQGAAPSETAKQFLRWDKVNGVEVPGLSRRRKAEADLFLRP